MLTSYRVGVTSNEDPSYAPSWMNIHYTDYTKALSRYNYYADNTEASDVKYIVLYKDIVEFDELDTVGFPKVQTFVLLYKAVDTSKIVQYNKQEIVTPAPEEPPTTVSTDFSFTTEMYETLTQ